MRKPYILADMGEALESMELRARLVGDEVAFWERLKKRFGLKTNTELLRLLITEKLREIDEENTRRFAS